MYLLWFGVGTEARILRLSSGISILCMWFSLFKFIVFPHFVLCCDLDFLKFKFIPSNDFWGLVSSWDEFSLCKVWARFLLIWPSFFGWFCGRLSLCSCVHEFCSCRIEQQCYPCRALSCRACSSERHLLWAIVTGCLFGVFFHLCSDTHLWGLVCCPHDSQQRSHSSAPSTRKAVELELSRHRCWEILLFFPCVDIDIGFQIRRSGWFFAQRLIAATWIKFPNFV